MTLMTWREDQLGCDGLAPAQENEIPVETHTDSTN